MSHKLDQTYGRWEFRARTDKGRGFGSAILLWPESERFPEDGEIDIMEVPSETRDRAHFIVHFPGPGGSDKVYGSYAEDDFSEWHTFAVDWLPDRIVYYVDGVERLRVTDSNIIPDKPMYLAMQFDQGPEKDWIKAPDATTPVAFSLQVDWLRVYAPARRLREPERLEGLSDRDATTTACSAASPPGTLRESGRRCSPNLRDGAAPRDPPLPGRLGTSMSTASPLPASASLRRLSRSPRSPGSSTSWSPRRHRRVSWPRGGGRHHRSQSNSFRSPDRELLLRSAVRSSGSPDTSGLGVTVQFVGLRSGGAARSIRRPLLGCAGVERDFEAVAHAGFGDEVPGS